MLNINSMARHTILDLLSKGTGLCIDATRVGQNDGNWHEAHSISLRACGYLNAANALLLAHPDMHNELIEHLDFVFMRNWARTGIRAYG